MDFKIYITIVLNMLLECLGFRQKVDKIETIPLLTEMVTDGPLKSPLVTSVANIATKKGLFRCTEEIGYDTPKVLCQKISESGHEIGDVAIHHGYWKNVTDDLLNGTL